MFQMKKILKTINPYVPNTTIFNPMKGDENIAINALISLLIDDTMSEETKYINTMIITNAVKVLKRLKGENITFHDLSILLTNLNDEGRKNYVMPLRKLSKMPDGRLIRSDIKRSNDELIDWFLNDYYAGIGGTKGAPQTYNNAVSLRSNISKILSNKYYSHVFGISDFDLYNLEPGTLVIFQCVDKTEPFYKMIDRFLKDYYFNIRVQRMQKRLNVSEKDFDKFEKEKIEKEIEEEKRRKEEKRKREEKLNIDYNLSKLVEVIDIEDF